MARLLSLNVGLPRDVSWQGRTVHTAIWKEPVQARRMVRRLNIDGDGQGDLAGHGGEDSKHDGKVAARAPRSNRTLARCSKSSASAARSSDRR